MQILFMTLSYKPSRVRVLGKKVISHFSVALIHSLSSFLSLSLPPPPKFLCKIQNPTTWWWGRHISLKCRHWNKLLVFSLLLGRVQVSKFQPAALFMVQKYCTEKADGCEEWFCFCILFLFSLCSAGYIRSPVWRLGLTGSTFPSESTDMSALCSF